MSTQHVDYPHEPGRLYDCPGCESACHCTLAVGLGEQTECVYEGEHINALVATWANGFGVWHVRVLRRVADPLALAREALRRELEPREAHLAPSVWQNPVRHLDFDDSIVYREGEAV